MHLQVYIKKLLFEPNFDIFCEHKELYLPSSSTSSSSSGFLD